MSSVTNVLNVANGTSVPPDHDEFFILKEKRVYIDDNF
jgi:hypothetical protein